MAGLVRVVLVTEFAHDDRPDGADPLDIRDQVVLARAAVKLDLGGSGRGRARAGLLRGVEDWDLVGAAGTACSSPAAGMRVNRNWDPVRRAAARRAAAAPQVRVSRTNDVLELLTACPRELDEHDFALTVNGKEVDWRQQRRSRQLREWVVALRPHPGRATRTTISRYSDRLAYWWDLSPWRGQEVELELTLRGTRSGTRSPGAALRLGPPSATCRPAASR